MNDPSSWNPEQLPKHWKFRDLATCHLEELQMIYTKKFSIKLSCDFLFSKILKRSQQKILNLYPRSDLYTHTKDVS